MVDLGVGTSRCGGTLWGSSGTGGNGIVCCGEGVTGVSSKGLRLTEECLAGKPGKDSTTSSLQCLVPQVSMINL